MNIYTADFTHSLIIGLLAKGVLRGDRWGFKARRSAYIYICIEAPGVLRRIILDFS